MLTRANRKKSMVRKERRLEHDVNQTNIIKERPGKKYHPWRWFAQGLTCCIPGFILKSVGGMTPPVQQAWREKIALCFICGVMMLILAFITFALQDLICVIPPFNANAQTINWAQLSNNRTNEIYNLMVYNGKVLSMTPYLLGHPPSDPDPVAQLVRSHIGKDATKAFSASYQLRAYAEDFATRYNNNQGIPLLLDETPMGCVIQNVLVIFSLIVILSVIIIRFVLAVYFSWFISRTLGKLRENRIPKLIKSRNARMRAETKQLMEKDAKSPGAKSFTSLHAVPESEYTEEVYTLMLVTCYSEGQEGIKTTMDSLASTIYDDSKKILFVVADGQITGSGNAKPTPELILELIELDTTQRAQPMSYEAVAEGSKRHNMAKVHVGHYNFDGHRVPTILVNKCGTPEEAASAKPGNRGKRDSQIIVMSFFKKVTLNESMTALEFDLFTKMQYLMGVTPDRFEIVLMVDADTRVEDDSLSRMVAVMVNDPLVIGLCGETRIMNKNESWVSRIQVFEYYLSHHLQKTFESIFGGVTCLPGCFCMWRIKAKKPDGYWVPILANPDIVETYSECVVDTLHKKNLLLLGEDRFLTTIMMRTFPRRKTMFVPMAYCKTTVPAEFRVLLSQRRRWYVFNSRRG